MTNIMTYQRCLLGIAGSVYLLWWFVVDHLLPSAFNPLSSRLFICALFAVVFALSYWSKFIQENLARFYALCAFALTFHYFYLYYNNIGDQNWIVGSYITIVAIGVTLEGIPTLINYTVLVLAGSGYVSHFDPTSVVGFPGTITILVLINLVAFLRSKAESERKARINAEIDKATAEAVNRTNMLFLANMSHELRTPLTSILGFSEILADAPELSDDSKDLLQRVRTYSKRLYDIVEQILILTQDDVAELQGQESPLNIRDFLNEEVQKLEAEREAKGLNLSLRFENLEKSIFVNHANLARIFTNVYSNAIKFTPKGSIEIFARLASTSVPEQMQLMIDITDSGIGIDQANWEKCFASFKQMQSEHNRTYGGAGVGLSIARKLARVMDGDITILSSQPGVGSKMQIYLKVRAA